MVDKVIALVGASGNLGRLIAQELLADPAVQLRLLVRAGSRDKVREFEERGAQVVEGDLTGGADGALAALCEGATTVVSAVQGGPELLVDGQAALLRAARTAGVRRFIPSTFSVDIFTVPEGQVVTGDLRRRFADLAEAERGDMEVTHIVIGAFLSRDVLFDFLHVVDPATSTAHVWGEGDAAMDFTTFADTARYTAAVAVDDRQVGRVFSAAGDTLDFAGVVAAFEAGTGTTLTVERLGSLDELDQRVADLQREAPEDLYAYLPFMYYRTMLRGYGRVDPAMNDRYPAITPTTFQQYVAQQEF